MKGGRKRSGGPNMASSSSKRRFRLSLGTQLALLIGLLLLLLTAAAVGLMSYVGNQVAGQSGNQELDGSLAFVNQFSQQRYLQLDLISRIFSTDQVTTLAQAVRERDSAAVLDLVEEYQNSVLPFNLGMVLDRNRQVVARTDAPSRTGGTLDDSSILDDTKKTLGIWQLDGKLYHAAAVPLVRDFDLVGFIVVAFTIDDAFAVQVNRVSGAEIAFLANAPSPSVVASTLEGQTPELVAALQSRGVFARVTNGETLPREPLTLAGRDWTALLAPLRNAAQQPVGTVVALSSPNEKLAAADFLPLLTALAILGLAALVAGILGSLFLARGSLKPARQLALAATEASHGNYEVPVPPGRSGELGVLAGALASLQGQLRERRALEFFVSRLARLLPEPAKNEAMPRPAARKLALVAVEMRRFANPRTGYDAEESVGRFARDLRRVAASVTANKGRLEAVFGHRLLATFDGDGNAQRALVAATEILHVLSERENVFDEPEPPIVALTTGGVVTGGVLQGGRLMNVVAGLPVQQLESLLREATPGEIFLAKTIHAQLAEPFQRAGVELATRRGLVSTQPLYVLNAEQAGRVTGVRSVAETTTGTTAGTFPGERRSLSEVTPGTLLGSRFEILAELGSGRMGVVFKARDQELGDLVTLKMLKPEVVADAVQFDRLRRVISLTRGLAHPNVVGVLDFGEAEKLPYVSMEYVRAVNLRYVIDQSRQIPVVAGFRMARQICAGLAAAHQEKILHLGLKPENVLLEPHGNVKLTDFGLSLPLRLGAGGVVAGVEYLAPEQLEGREPDARADVYACGVILFEMFTGRVPYAGASPDEIRLKHLQEDAPPPSRLAEDVPPGLDAVILRCLAKAADQRYPGPAAVLEALEALRA